MAVGISVGLVVVLLVVFADSECGKASRKWSLDEHRARGKYRVRYREGGISQPFTYQVAKDYVDLFGGEIVRR